MLGTVEIKNILNLILSNIPSFYLAVLFECDPDIFQWTPIFETHV